MENEAKGNKSTIDKNVCSLYNENKRSCSEEASTLSIEKSVGRIIELIYQDSQGKITQRKIRVRQVDRGMLMGFDTVKHAYRTFALDRILASRPVS